MVYGMGYIHSYIHYVCVGVSICVSIPICSSACARVYIYMFAFGSRERVGPLCAFVSACV